MVNPVGKKVLLTHFVCEIFPQLTVLSHVAHCCIVHIWLALVPSSKIDVPPLRKGLTYSRDARFQTGSLVGYITRILAFLSPSLPRSFSLAGTHTRHLASVLSRRVLGMLGIAWSARCARPFAWRNDPVPPFASPIKGRGKLVTRRDKASATYGEFCA